MSKITALKSSVPGVIFDHTLYKKKWDWLIEHPGKTSQQWLWETGADAFPACAYAMKLMRYLREHLKDSDSFKYSIPCQLCPFGDYTKQHICYHPLYGVWLDVTNSIRILDNLSDAYISKSEGAFHCENKLKRSLIRSAKTLATMMRNLPLRPDMTILTK